jgi:hypothetical protein
MEQIMERLLAETKAEMKANQETVETQIDCLASRMNVNHKEVITEMKTHREEMSQSRYLYLTTII